MPPMDRPPGVPHGPLGGPWGGWPARPLALQAPVPALPPAARRRQRRFRLAVQQQQALTRVGRGRVAEVPSLQAQAPLLLVPERVPLP